MLFSIFLNLFSKRPREKKKLGVDHAVLVTGWGEENGVKYWTIQNSWDNYWGEDGYMRIRRGDNDSGYA